MNNVRYTYARQGSRGYVLLLAGIIASLVTTLGILIAAFIRNDLLLVGSAEKSEFAFYAARAVAECGQYYEYGTSTYNSFSVPRVGSLTITCMGVATSSGSAVSGDQQLFSFDWSTDSGQSVCSKLVVIKTTSGNSTTTRMLARGYSTGCASVTAAGTIERVIEYTY